MSKKLESKSAVGRLPDSSNSSAEVNQHVLLDYVLAHAKGDTRPYLNIKIYDCKLLGLLDSGATNTVLGGPGWDLLKSSCIVKPSEQTSCVVASGQTCDILGMVSLPIMLCGKTKIINALVIPTLPHSIILGMDFWKVMRIIPDMFSGEWVFKDSSQDISPPQLSIISSNFLTAEQKKRLDMLIESTFGNMGTKLGCTTLVEHVIKTNSPPLKQRHYPLSPPLQKQVNEELTKMLKDGVIEPSNSPWASPILLIKKSHGNYRFVVDFRQLNKVTEKDAYPLPFVSATLDKLRDSHYLTTLDIKSAYWQIPLAEESKPMTAFVVPNRGLFQFRRMPMGLHTAPATWQRFIDQVIGIDLEKYVFVYLDDVIICTESFDKHLDILREVLSRLTKAGLTLNREKCHFCKSELHYLGYVVGAGGLMVDPAKVEAILQIPQPKSVSEVRRLIGIASWYRRFVPNFSSLTAPLCQLLKKNQVFLWSQECENSFRTLKEYLVSAPLLSCPNFDKPFVVQTDASDYGLGAVLSQTDDEGNERVICYLSRSLSKSERKYSTTEKECLAVLFAVERLRPYLEGVKFTVITDHFSLKWLNSIRDPIGRIARWAVRLQQYDFEVVHRKGCDHAVPDALSRSVPRIDAITLPQPKDRWYNKMVRNITDSPAKYPLWRLDNNGQLFKKVDILYPDLTPESDGWLLVVPKENRLEIISSHHDPPTSSHLGVYKTRARIAQKYYWPKMKQDVARYISRCSICLKTKPIQRPPTGLMLSQGPTATRPFQILSMDIVGPLPRSVSGYSYILSIQDIFSKFILLFPLRKATSNQVATIFEDQVILMFGAPQKVIMDNGVQFTGHILQDVLKKYDIMPCHISNFHPQSNPVERAHRVIKTALTSYVAGNHRLWDKFLQKVACAIRSSCHETTKLTPNFIMFGREIQLSGKDIHPLASPFETDIDPKTRSEALLEVFQDTRHQLKSAYESSKVRYNLRRRDEKFQLNQPVWKRKYALSDAAKGITAKFVPKFEGPFTICRILSPWSYELKDENDKSKGVWHAKDLKAHPPEEVHTDSDSD